MSNFSTVLSLIRLSISIERTQTTSALFIWATCNLYQVPGTFPQTRFDHNAPFPKPTAYFAFKFICKILLLTINKIMKF